MDHEDQIRPYETDALSAYKQKPLAVIFPENTEEVSKILSYCNQERIKVVEMECHTLRDRNRQLEHDYHEITERCHHLEGEVSLL